MLTLLWLPLSYPVSGPANGVRCAPAAMSVLRNLAIVVDEAPCQCCGILAIVVDDPVGSVSAAEFGDTRSLPAIARWRLCRPSWSYAFEVVWFDPERSQQLARHAPHIFYLRADAYCVSD
jgi:hypothetical protein